MTLFIENYIIIIPGFGFIAGILLAVSFRHPVPISSRRLGRKKGNDHNMPFENNFIMPFYKVKLHFDRA